MNNFKIIYNQSSILVQLYKHKHLISLLNHENNTMYNQHFNIRFLKYQKVFKQKNVLYTGFDLCGLIIIYILYIFYIFFLIDNLKLLKIKYKYVDLSKIIEL